MLQYKTYSPEKLLKEFDLFKVPVDLNELCEQLGIEKSSKMKFVSHSGEIKVDENDAVKIWINPLDHENRRRFTLAHELGHFIYDIIPYLETKDGDSQFTDTKETLRRDGRQHPEEYRANDFAARILMPEKLIIKHGKDTLKSLQNKNGSKKVKTDLFVTTMANLFRVSEQAMKIRLKNIGVIRS